MKCIDEQVKRFPLELNERLGLIVEDLKRYNPDKIIVFGSAARGDGDEFSDVDLVVIKETNTQFVNRLVEVISYIRPQLRPVDVFVYTGAEFEQMKKDKNPFVEQVLEEGKLIYEKS